MWDLSGLWVCGYRKDCTIYSIKKFVTGPIDTNTYVVTSQGERGCIVVDPSSGCADVLDYIRGQSLAVVAVCLTHGHFDHILGIGEITGAFPDAHVWVHPDERQLLENPEFNGAVMLGMDFSYTAATEPLVEGPLTIGPFSFSVIHVPGHSPGGCALLFGRDCLSGDSIFAGSVGRTDFPCCDGDLLLRGIREKLLTLPDDTVVWPGHFGRTTIGREKRQNPFLI